MKHKVAQLKTEITINRIKAQREQRRKNKKQNNSLILHILFGIWGKFEFFFSCVPHCNDSLLRLDVNLGEINIW